MIDLDEALADITHATYRRWIEHDTPNGNWSRRRFQETENVINRDQIRYLIGKTHPSELLSNTTNTRATCQPSNTTASDTRNQQRASPAGNTTPGGA